MKDLVLINHEKIHLQQQIELGVVFFYVFYLAEFLYFKLKGNNHQQAYQKISFEREAYANESDLSYLRFRKRWSQWKN